MFGLKSISVTKTVSAVLEYFKYTSLLLRGQGSNNATTASFVDSSSNNFTVTNVGTVTQGAFSPFGVDDGYWSNYFDGSGDSLTAPAGSAFAYGTGDFTVEAWIYPVATNASNAMLFAQSVSGTNYFLVTFNANRTISFYGTASGGGSAINGPVAVSLNTWSHVAVVRNSGTVTVYVNGVGGTGTSNTTNFTNTSYVPTIAAYSHNSSNNYTGYISNLRIVKGTAVYTSNFTPSTTPLRAISGTSLLTCQSNRFVDNSSNAFALTTAGDVAVNAFGPFERLSSSQLADAGYYGSYFNSATGDYLALPSTSALALGAGDFCVEFWMNLNSSTQQGIFSNSYNSGGGDTQFEIQVYQGKITVLGWYTIFLTSSTDVVTGTWQHIAVTRSGSTMRLFVDGVQTATTTSSNDFSSSQAFFIGRQAAAGNTTLNGYLSNLRVVKGSAVYTSTFIPSTFPLVAIANTALLTCQNSTFRDNSSNALTVTPYGSAAVNSASPFSEPIKYALSDGGSAYMANSYVSVPNNAALNFGTGDFTVECWAYIPPGTTGVALWGKWAGGIDNYLLRFDSNKFVFYYVGGSITQSNTTPYNSWTHVAVVRSGTAINLYVNGVSRGSASSSFNSNTNTVFAMGAYGADLARYTGYIANLRVVKGTAVYTSTFTPPVAPVTAISGTSLLLNCANIGAFDSMGKTMLTGFGDVKISTAQYKYGTSSIAFDGTGDYLSTVVANPNFALRAGDFTVEMWIRPSVVNVAQAVFDQRNPNTQDLGFAIYIANTGVPVVGTANVNYITSASALSANTWYHIAVTRSGNDMKMFVNGTQVGSTYNASSRDFTNSITLIGSGAVGAFNGYIQDFRFTKGYARYTSTFTPPTQL